MGLTLCIELLADCYEATLGGTEPEWPPHPARVFCALVSVAIPGSADDDALRWLEDQRPPCVSSADRVGSSPSRPAFVPTNTLVSTGKHQTYLGRTSAAQAWARTVPASRTVEVCWPNAEPTQERLTTLDQLARRVGYLGRSTSQALLSFDTEDRCLDEAPVYEPSQEGDDRLRVPYSGYLHRLRGAFEEGQAPWSVPPRTATYRRVAEPAPAQPEVPAAAAPAYRDLLVFAFGPGEGIDGGHAPAVARAFKAAVLQRLGRPHTADPWEAFEEGELSLLHGHHDGTLRQCAFLALPFVGSRHATGEVLGVSVALSPDLDPALRVALLRLAGLDRDDGPRLTQLQVPGLGRRCHLEAPDDRVTLSPRRWSATSQRWTTALPIVLDWFPKRRLPPEEVVARGFVAAGYPRPELVEILPAARPRGSPHIPRRALARRHGDPNRPAVHAALSFDRPVTGPVVVGHLRHFGLGLCLPGGDR